MTTACAHPTCSTQIRDGYLMCPPHWGQVPAQLRHAVLDTLTAYRRYNSHTNRIAYLAARKAAIEAVS